MKKISLSLLCLVVFSCKISLALLCLSGESTYQVMLSDDQASAQVLKGLENVRFGELDCNKAPQIEGQPTIALRCHSRHVADAGFVALFFADMNEKIASVNLSEIYLAGAKNIATLPCLDVMGTLERRTLWINGERNIEGIGVAAGGEIEVNIRTVAGTGYSWELQKNPLPNTVSLMEDPIFIPTSEERIGGVGVTRFRFRVVENSNRGFTLFFQLRRPWEETPTKQFYIRFNALRG